MLEEPHSFGLKMSAADISAKTVKCETLQSGAHWALSTPRQGWSTFTNSEKISMWALTFALISDQNGRPESKLRIKDLKTRSPE